MGKTWQTRLIHPEARAPEGYSSLATPVYRGSTTLFASASAVTDEWDQERAGYTYGLYGTPTALELAARICELEGGRHTHPDARRTGRDLADRFRAAARGRPRVAAAQRLSAQPAARRRRCSREFGVEATFYDPLVGAGSPR